MSNGTNEARLAREERTSRVLSILKQELHAVEQWHSELLELLAKMDRAGADDAVLDEVEAFLKRGRAGSQ